MDRLWPAPKMEYPGPWQVDADPDDLDGSRKALEERNRKIDEWDAKEDERIRRYMEEMNSPERKEQREWQEKSSRHLLGHFACTVHCLVYTLSVWLFTFYWINWAGLVLCFLAHWPIDRFRLARWWMEKVSWQKDFANGPLAPWSVVIVDNTFHLLTLYVIWLIPRTHL